MNNIKFNTSLLTGELTVPDAKKYFSRFGWFAFTFYICLSLFQATTIAVLAIVNRNILLNPLFAEILSFVSLYAVAFPIAYLVLRPLPQVVPLKAKLSVWDTVKAICICQAFMSIGNYVSAIFLLVSSTATGNVPENPIAVTTQSQPIWMSLLFTVILAPVLEEIFFRKLVCDRLTPLGEGYAVVLSSVVFAFCHGNFFQLFYAFLTGCLFSFIYVKTGKLRYSMIAHVAVNFLGALVPELLNRSASFDQLPNGELALTSDMLLSLALTSLFSLISLAMVIFGIVTLIRNRRAITFDSGILPPPKGQGISCLFLNFGVASAIAVFALQLLGSLA